MDRAESIFALLIQRGRQSGLNSPLVCSAKHPVGSERQTCDAAGADRSTLDALAAPLASECIAGFCFTDPELQRVESESQPQSC